MLNGACVLSNCSCNVYTRCLARIKVQWSVHFDPTGIRSTAARVTYGHTRVRPTFSSPARCEQTNRARARAALLTVVQGHQDNVYVRRGQTVVRARRYQVSVRARENVPRWSCDAGAPAPRRYAEHDGRRPAGPDGTRCWCCVHAGRVHERTCSCFFRSVGRTNPRWPQAAGPVMGPVQLAFTQLRPPKQPRSYSDPGKVQGISSTSIFCWHFFLETRYYIWVIILINTCMHTLLRWATLKD
jgi:hypothetical protein